MHAVVVAGAAAAAVLAAAVMSGGHSERFAATGPPKPPAALKPAVTAPDLAPKLLSTAPTFFPPGCAAVPPARYARTFAKAGRKNGIDPCLLARQTKAESNFDPKARSPAGAIGISQFLPETAREWGIDPWNPEEAIPAQARYLAWNRARWAMKMPGRTNRDRLALGLAGYNHGFGNMLRNQRKHSWGTWPQARSHMPDETRNYVRKIMDW